MCILPEEMSLHQSKSHRMSLKCPQELSDGAMFVKAGKNEEIPGYGQNNMASILIKDTTKEERARIVAESIGNVDGACDGCAAGMIEMYQPYIDGVKELKDINMEFRASYVSGAIDKEERSGCGYQ